MTRSIIVLPMILFLAASVLIITNASLADAQQTLSSPSVQTQSTAYTDGEAVGIALGVRDGAAAGARDDVSGLAFNAEGYLPPSEVEVCTVYEDFYTDLGYVCANTQHYLDFSNGYMSGHRDGYYPGYVAGYYLTTTLGSLYQPSAGGI